MANTFKKKIKLIGAYIWSFFKGSLLTSIMYFCASAILMMLVIKGEKVDWTNSDLAWCIVCIVGGAAYNALAAWSTGGSHYEMLVSGNVKRYTVDAYGNPYKMSNHKMVKEYRIWKGFAIGAFSSIIPILFGILLGANGSVINSGEFGKGIGVLLVLAFFLSGWTVLPFYCMNQAGIAVSYYYSLFLAIIPVLVTGGLYIAGAYARRNKAIRQQKIAELAAKAEEEKQKNKKINYGGLPGTKPKKRK